MKQLLESCYVSIIFQIHNLSNVTFPSTSCHGACLVLYGSAPGIIMAKITIRPLSVQLAKRAKDELYENPTEIEKHIKELRQWILEQPHLKARTGLFCCI